MISCAPGDAEHVQSIAEKHGVPCRRIGSVGAVNGEFVVRTPEVSLRTAVEDLAEVYYDAIPRLMHAGADRG